MLDNQTPESRRLDYKRELNLENKDQRKELARDVASFANAGGGFLVFGIDEDEGVPTKIVGVPCEDLDALKLKLDNTLADHIQPKVQGLSYGAVSGLAPNPVIVVHIPRSWVGPHMAALPKQSHFYSRGTAGRVTLDVHEIRNAFIAGTEASERVRRFRDERIGRIAANEGGLPLWRPASLLAVHLCPLEDTPDVFAAVAGKPDKLAPSRDSWPGVAQRFTLDGYLTHPPADQVEVFSYLLAFRTGAFESCEPILINESTPPLVSGHSLERNILDAASLFLARSRESGSDGPLVLLTAMLGVNGVRVTGVAPKPGQRDHTIDRSTLVLPEIVVQGPTVSGQDLRPVFDAIWQSSGWSGSPNFTREGTWVPAR